MQISNETIHILKNLLRINPSLFFDKSGLLRSINISRTVMAEAQVAETFPRNFAIYRLDQLINILSMLPDANIYFYDNHLEIILLYQSYKIYYSDVKSIRNDTKEIKLPNAIVQFVLDENMLKVIKNGIANFMLPHISFESTNGKMFVKNEDLANKTTNIFLYEIGKCDKEFKLVILRENFLIDYLRNYEFQFIEKPLVVLKSPEITYMLSCDNTHTKI